jgi:hypothetical protein
MRFAVLLAAMAALWVQPAQAVVTFSAVGVGTFGERPGCIIGQTTPACMAAPSITLAHFSIQGVLDDSFLNPQQTALGFGLRGLPGCPLDSCYLTGTQGGAFEFRSMARPGWLDQEYRITGANFRFMVTPGGTTTSSISVSRIAAIPEPASWALILLGFGAIGWAMRKQRGTATGCASAAIGA